MTWCLCTESRGHGGQVRSWGGRARTLPSGLRGSPALPTPRFQTLASDTVREHISLMGVMPTVTSFAAAALGNSPAVQWLRLQASTAGDMGSVSDQETMILHAELCSQKKKKKHTTMALSRGSVTILISQMERRGMGKSRHLPRVSGQEGQSLASVSSRSSGGSGPPQQEGFPCWGLEGRQVSILFIP